QYLDVFVLDNVQASSLGASAFVGGQLPNQGTSGADTLTGGDGPDTLSGLAGDDTLTGRGGNDSLDGGDGADTAVFSGAVGSYVIADLGGGAFSVADQVAGRDGTDTVTRVEYLKFSDQTVDVGTLGGVTITGTAGVDTISPAKVPVGQPKPTVHGDTVYGLDGNDKLDGGVGADHLYGGAGNDIYTVDNIGDQAIEASGEGTDLVKASVSFTLGANVENLTLTGAGLIDGTGNELINTITGNGAANSLSGMDGADKLYGGAGNDSLYGGAGADSLDGGVGADHMAGGADNDTYVVDDLGDTVIEAAGEGTDLVKASVSFTLGSEVENLTLTGTGAIDGTGNDLANKLTGNDGANTLMGLDGKDTLIGGASDDVLNGGAGADALTGGAGADHFVFDTLGPAADKDTIKDFVAGEDHIDLARSAFAAFAGDPAGALSASEFVIGTAATTAAQHLIYNAATGALYYDDDGSGHAAKVQIAVLSGHPTLTAGDVLLI
ncbi:MAG: hypothetical protein JWM33_1223, partial [Caulobacteraceae bacterium]|nr:hypothetical protein [Caulobacteraceae bacterium]